MQQKITIEATIYADIKKTWDYYTLPEYITKWNFADPSWHCPSASNDLKIGGKYLARMEAKDGSFGFDFEAYYTELDFGRSFTYSFGGRMCSVEFKDFENQTLVKISFDPENENSLELQQNGWQLILNNFKDYIEEN